VSVNRREFLQLAGALTVAASLRALPAMASGQPATVKAVLFDAFPIFDARPVAALAEKLFPEKGAELTALWRSRQFEYQWLRVLSGNYADFWQVTEDSLVFACTSLKLRLSTDARAQLMHAWMNLKAWPDVSGALHALKQRGIRLAFLSNMTRRMLDTNIASAGLDGMFDEVISSDQIRSYKPDARVYQLGLDTLKLKREEVLFAAFAGWDAAGAKTFGYPTCWVNRQQAATEVLGVTPDVISKGLDEVVRYAARIPASD
jgi:2-haloacid dehalogenase